MKGLRLGAWRSPRVWRSVCMGFLLLAAAFLVGGRSVTALAAEEEYTYTVRLYAGNQGALTEDGIEVSSTSAVIKYGRDCTEITGLKYDDAVYIRPQDAAASTDSRYYVRGVRRSGRDNSEAEAPSFRVASDRDYVVAYGISGEMAAYTVNYLDLDGNQIMASDTYYGNIGERQYVSSRYVDGYQPQALNMVKTLSANEAENVFNFEYAPVTAPAPAPAPTPAPAPAAPEAPAPAEPEAPAPAPEEEPGVEIPEEDVPLGGDLTANNGGQGNGRQDNGNEEESQGQQDVMDIDDETVPLASGLGNDAEQSGILMGYMPVYIGIGAAAVAVLAISAVYLKKKRKPAANLTDADRKGGRKGRS